MSATADRLTVIIELLTPDECKTVLIDMASRNMDSNINEGCIREIRKVVNVCSCESYSSPVNRDPASLPHKPSCRLNRINKL